MGFSDELAGLYERDLGRLHGQLAQFPTDESLWETLPGVINPAGNLALHLEGNLREYVGRVLGGVEYVRDRPLEFSARGVAKAELLERVAGVKELVPRIVAGLSAEEWEEEYPLVVLGSPMSTREFVMHLYGHLGWHLGQMDYLRRILGEQSKA